MEKISKEKFTKIYKQKFESNLSEFENSRISYINTQRIVLIIAAVVFVLGISIYLAVKNFIGIIIAVAVLIAGLFFCQEKRIVYRQL